MKVLIPIDFSGTSIAAFNYAQELSKYLEMDIAVTHIVTPAIPTSDSVYMNPIEIAVQAAENRLERFVEDHRIDLDRDSVQGVDKIVRVGDIGNVLSKMVDELEVDLVVMGTRDKRTILNKILGTASSAVLHTVNKPIIFVHENTRFNPIQKICFAFDAEGELLNAIKHFHEINSKIEAPTDFLHIEESTEESIISSKQDIIATLFDEGEPSYSFQVKALKAKSVSDAVMDYCLFEKKDLLVMVHRDHGLIKDIINGSFSMRLIERFHLPIMVVKE